jgi:hypothetical protein
VLTGGISVVGADMALVGVLSLRDKPKVSTAKHRLLNVCCLAMLGLACQGGPTQPGSGLGDPLLKFSRQPVDGFCPRDGEVFKATVWRNGAGAQTLTGSRLVGFDALRDSCIQTINSGRCLVEVPFENRVLTPAQSAEFQRLLDAIPVVPHNINYACDPCLITRYEFGGRTEDANPCDSVPEAYHQSLVSVEDFLNSLSSDSGL